MKSRLQESLVDIRSHIALLREQRDALGKASAGEDVALGDLPSILGVGADLLELLLDECLAARRAATGIKYQSLAEIAADAGISPDECFHALASLGLARGSLARHRATLVGQRLSTSDGRWDARVRDMIEAQFETWRASTDIGLFLRTIADAESSMGDLK